MNLGRYLKQAERLIANNSPAILTAVGVVGALTTAYLTGKATWKAAELVNEHNQELDINDLWMPPEKKFKLVWKLYIPAAGTAALTVAAIVCSNRISSRRAAALAAAYSISERAFDEYKTKVIEKMGEKKEQAVRDEIAQDRLDRNPVVSKEIIITGDGDVLCYDAYTGRYFQSSAETMRKAQNDINQRIIHDHYASLSDFYDLIGLPQTRVSDEVGWNLDTMLDIDISAGLSKKKEPCLVLTFDVSPARQYFRTL